MKIQDVMFQLFQPFQSFQSSSEHLELLKLLERLEPLSSPRASENFAIAVADRLVPFSDIENIGYAHVLAFK